MSKHPSQELPIRSKVEMAKEVGQIIHCLHTGKRSTADLLLVDLKTRAVYMGEEVQQAVLRFAQQVEFQYDYDPWHKVTEDVNRAADKLIEELGLNPPL